MSLRNGPYPLNERTYRQRLVDDERHMLRMTGQLDDDLFDLDAVDHGSRHYDFASPYALRASAGQAAGREQAGTHSSCSVPAETSSVPPATEGTPGCAGSGGVVGRSRAPGNRRPRQNSTRSTR